MNLKYKSTRSADKTVTASEAILKGLADDGGLFVPEYIPKLDVTMDELKDMTYQETAYAVMKQFLTDFTEEELKNCIRSAYGPKFDTEAIAPLVKVGDTYHLELFHGETIAFKDMALSILPHLLTTAARKNHVTNEIVILTVVYYVYAYAKLLENEEIKAGEEINVTVPTGNFGNILAAYYAKQMGVPIAKLICASNENKVLFDFFQTGVYDRNREFILTSSPSMDILISSNLERLIYTVAGQDAEKNSQLMARLKEEGSYEITSEMREKLEDFAGGFATEAETAQTIRSVYERTGYVMDTHTAVAVCVCAQYRKAHEDGRKCLVASTASPYKFIHSVMTAIDEKYADTDEFELVDELSRISGTDIPGAIEEIRNADIRHNKECDADRMKETVKEILGV